MSTISSDSAATVDVADIDSPNVQPILYSQLNWDDAEVAGSSSPRKTAAEPPIYASINFLEKRARRQLKEQSVGKEEVDSKQTEEAEEEEEEEMQLLAEGEEVSCSEVSARWNFATAGEYEEILEYASSKKTVIITTTKSTVTTEVEEDDEHIYEPIEVRPEVSKKSAKTARKTAPRQKGILGRYFSRRKRATDQDNAKDNNNTKPDTAPNTATIDQQQQQQHSRLVTEFRKLWPSNKPSAVSQPTQMDFKSLKQSLNRMCRRQPDERNNNAAKPETGSSTTTSSTVTTRTFARNSPPEPKALITLLPMNAEEREQILAARTRFLNSCLQPQPPAEEGSSQRRTPPAERFFHRELREKLAQNRPNDGQNGCRR